MEPLRFSQLKHIARSPAHFRHYIENGMPDSAAMLLGRYVHRLVLGKGDRDFVLYDGERRGKAWAEFQLLHANKEIVRRAEADVAEQMAAAVAANPAAVEALDGEREVTLRWSWFGRHCKGTLDAVPAPGVTDLKTTIDANPRRFIPDATSRGYLAQLAWYIDAALACGYTGKTEGRIVAVESKPPYPVVVYRLTEAALEFGRRQYLSWFDALLECERGNYWPGYASDVVDLDAPPDLLYIEEAA